MNTQHMEPIPYFSSFANGGTLNGLNGDSYVIEAQEKNGSSAKFVKRPNNCKRVVKVGML